MSDLDQHDDGNTKQEAAHLFGLWFITMVVAIIFISTLSTRTPEEAKESAETKTAESAPALAQAPAAPPLDVSQTMAPLPAGHPSISCTG